MDRLNSLWGQAWFEERGRQWLSRVLVALTGLLLLAMPVTEYLCNWDRFLRGGPDVEFNVLAWLLFAAMVVLSMQGRMLRPAWLGRASEPAGERLEEKIDSRRRHRGSRPEPASHFSAFAAGLATAPLRI